MDNKQDNQHHPQHNPGVLDNIGSVVAAGWGDKILAGALVGFLDGHSPHDVYELIKSNGDIAIPDKDLPRIRRMVAYLHGESLTPSTIIKTLSRSRPDIVSVIVNHPGGISWLDKQISIIKTQLHI